MKETEWCAGMKAGVKLRDKDDGRLAFSKKKRPRDESEAPDSRSRTDNQGEPRCDWPGLTGMLKQEMWEQR